MKQLIPLLLLFLTLPFLRFGHASLQTQNNAPVEVQKTQLAEGLWFLATKGAAQGNVVVSIGKDGVLVVDDFEDRYFPQIKAAIATLTDQPIRFIINTHWHPDHAGSNKRFGEAGVLIAAHENVRKRLSSDQFIELFKAPVKAEPAAAWPVITCQKEMTFHFNDEEIQVLHQPHAHTDGDVVVHFRRANVVHFGDTFMTEGYPFIDWSSGGTLDGIIAMTERIQPLLNPATKLVPGHGRIGQLADLQAYRSMLIGVRAKLAPLLKAGKTLPEIQQAKPTKPFDARWGKGFFNPDMFVMMVYNSTQKK